jgi:hypothetical protein
MAQNMGVDAVSKLETKTHFDASKMRQNISMNRTSVFTVFRQTGSDAKLTQKLTQCCQGKSWKNNKLDSYVSVK